MRIPSLLMISCLTNRRRRQQRNGKRACDVVVNDVDLEILCSLDEKGGEDSMVWKTDCGCFEDDETFLLLLLLNKKLKLKK